MGASEWRYFVPYQSNIDQAFQALRQSVFEQHGEDLRIDPDWLVTFEDFLPPDPDFTDEDRAAYFEEWQRLQALPEPTTIEELLEWNGAEGTGSILDMFRVSTLPKAFTVSPLTERQLLKLFGTTTPTHAQVDQARDQYHQLRERSSGLYVVVYRDGKPDEIFFSGWSGD